MSFRGLFIAVLLTAQTIAFAQAPGERSAIYQIDCDRACLIGFARGYMQALAKKDASRAQFAADVRFTENNVELVAGRDGLWRTITGVAATGLEAADASTGQVAWIGAVEENGQPAYYGMRLRVVDRKVAEVETVVVRRTGLPLPFGDTSKLTHDPAFGEVLAPQERRPRERLLAVTDSYFNTVELNDGIVFAPFHAECARTENGIVTTSAGLGSSGDIAQGCENQFKLGIYRINKRIRERRYTLVDEERGVVVATGFFDHANTFDTYKTTDGKDRKTLLKWPNSISLVEAFKIRDGRIYRIEAVFTYVPYFMHSPFFPVPPVTAAVRDRPLAVIPAARVATGKCERECLIKFADQYMEALVKRDPAGVPWAKDVRFTENSVPMMIGDGLWGSVRKKSSRPMYVTDPATGNVVWLGLVEEHDAPAFYAMRLKVQGGLISEVETVLARKGNPGAFGDPSQFQVDSSFDEMPATPQRLSRKRLQSLADGYFASQLRNEQVRSTSQPATSQPHESQGSKGQGSDSQRRENGQQSLRVSVPPERIRARRFPVIDEQRGVIVAQAFADFPADKETAPPYPRSREALEILQVRDGKIERVEAISVFQPYGMPSPWTQ
jgi:hypothetical protein